ncbi:flagellar motor stator protein MotA [Zavarzinia compransoris]|uniref:flagellar motor stator protein MotA n=1 Tax=Zavarzinia marina TaxID=2911065 RepID=UPI001F2CD504|nr:flagellar motor stator protein MotA [Zavarzinia marina]MCF4167685.1 flagellar motor stator protein MotA [Zavarzinia marina]
MLLIIGIVVVLGSVLSGYILAGGHVEVLWQPLEFLIIFGAAIGAYIIANPPPVLKKTGKAIAGAMKGPRYKQDAFLELLTLLYSVFKLAKSKGMLALEQHVENPHDSTLFNQFPTFAKDHHAVTFLCDYLRLMTLGTENAFEMESLIDLELETHAAEEHEVSHAIQNMADGMPALGIVAAVLGIIHTMGSITEPPEVLGHLIGAALVGTFMGVWMSYGFVAPIANSVRATHEAEMRYLHCIKAGLLAHLQGYPPAVSVEFARKALQTHVRPTFYEVEEATQKLQPV